MIGRCVNLTSPPQKLVYGIGGALLSPDVAFPPVSGFLCSCSTTGVTHFWFFSSLTTLLTGSQPPTCPTQLSSGRQFLCAALPCCQFLQTTRAGCQVLWPMPRTSNTAPPLPHFRNDSLHLCCAAKVLHHRIIFFSSRLLPIRVASLAKASNSSARHSTKISLPTTRGCSPLSLASLAIF